MYSEQDLFNKLDALNIEHKTFRHKPLFTVKDTDENLPQYGNCKNLFLKDKKKRFWLITTLAHTPVALKSIEKKVHAPQLHFASPAELKQYLGLTPGAVTPFGIINDHEQAVHIVLDEILFNEPLVGFHPLHNEATTYIKPTDLELFIKHQENHLQIVSLKDLK